MQHISIRQATPADAASILAIYAPYITDTVITFETAVPSLTDFTARVEEICRDYPYLVCEADGRVVGYAYASKHAVRAAYRYSVDVSIYIEPAYHRLGIGRLLYTELLAQVKDRGFYTAYAGITLPNEKSVGLHKAFGFTEAGVFHKVGYKANRWLDVIWLEKMLREYNTPEAEKRLL